MDAGATDEGAITAKILVVDDDPVVLSSLKLVLERVGYGVVSADSGESAVALAREINFDLALCDRHMPGMDGIELLKRLRELQPMCSRVLLTGGLDLATTVRAVNRGAVTRVLEKPIQSEALRQVVFEAIEGQRRMVRAYEELQQASVSAERDAIVQCLASDELQLALQPVVRAGDGAIFGYEALLRSSHPDFGSPLAVIGAVERHKLVHEFAEVVVDRAAKCLSTLRSDVSLFLNIHPAELADPDALENRLSRLQPYAPRVILEITERSSIYGVAAWAHSVDRIERLGFKVAVDDLGAGYSALSVLAELKPHYIKVDMSIIRDADTRPHKQRLIDLLCRFADATDAKLVAEGIETEPEAAAVRACGAHLLQGYLFGRPRLQSPLRVVSPQEAESAAG